MKNAVLILGAGSGTRMGGSISKLLLPICGQTVLERSVSAFYHHPYVQQIIVVCRERDQGAFQAALADYQRVQFAFGGATRQQSVQNALHLVEADTELLLIHDGARPLVTEKVITDTLEKAQETKAAATGVPVKDTIKRIDRQGIILDTPDRSALFSIQTPQIFDYQLYCRAAKAAAERGIDCTDDCQLVERLGVQVSTVTGDYGNLKITTREDLPMAEAILASRGGSGNANWTRL